MSLDWDTQEMPVQAFVRMMPPKWKTVMERQAERNTMQTEGGANHLQYAVFENLISLIR